MPVYCPDTGEVVERDWGELWALLEHGCGHMDASACLRDMLAACEREGVDVRFGQRVLAIEESGGRVEGVRYAANGGGRGDGGTAPRALAAGAVVNCSGPWFEQLNARVGVATSTRMLPTRIQVGHKPLPDDKDLLNLPFVADCWGGSGIYFMPRRQSKQLVFGSIDHKFESEIVDPDDFNDALDPDVRDEYLDRLFHRLPTLPRTARDVSGFSSMYTVNQEDVHPVVGPSAEFENLILCNGFSGHGFKLAPAVGSLVAQQLERSDPQLPAGAEQDGAWKTSIPLDFLAADREPLSLEVKTHFA